MPISSQARQEWREGSETNVHDPDRIMKRHECPATKTCSICQLEKSIDCFSTGRKQCKPCRSAMERMRYEANKPQIRKKRAQFHKEHKERLNKISREYYQNNRERMIAAQLERDAMRYDDKLEYERQRYADNADKIKSVQSEWRAKNKAKIVARDIRRQRALENATPPWADFSAMEEVYQEARRLTEETGIKHHVDHIIPLQGKNVSGLHIAANLQVLTEKENLRKSNKFG